MKSYLVHLRNKYPLAQVQVSDSSLMVLKDGEILCALQKDCHGWKDIQKEVGARDAFDLSPIAKDYRAHKLHKDGSVGRDEEYEARHALAVEHAKKVPCGRVFDEKKCEELKKVQA